MTAERPASPPKPSPAEGDRKRPYLTPAVRHEKVFEVMALACGKVQVGPTCASQKKAS